MIEFCFETYAMHAIEKLRFALAKTDKESLRLEYLARIDELQKLLEASNCNADPDSSSLKAINKL